MRPPATTAAVAVTTTGARLRRPCRPFRRRTFNLRAPAAAPTEIAWTSAAPTPAAAATTGNQPGKAAAMAVAATTAAATKAAATRLPQDFGRRSRNTGRQGLSHWGYRPIV